MHVMIYTITIIISYDNSQCEITHGSEYNHVGNYSLPATIIPYNTKVASHYIAKISGLATQNLIDSLRLLLIRMLI